MFIWDFVADTVLGQVFDWVYAKIVEFMGEFFTMMNGKEITVSIEAESSIFAFSAASLILCKEPLSVISTLD